MTFDLGSEFGWVIFAALAIIVECFIVGGTIGRVRGRLFTQEFMDKNFGDEHKKYFNESISKGGYPDMGNGLYSRKLDYGQWLEFNIAQRTHLNFVENIGLVIPALLIGGVTLPIASAILGAVFFIGRLLYTIGYRTGGPAGRTVGAVIGILSQLALIGLAVNTGLVILNQAK
jgi:uncharacterized membrane protein YecN with MAPEG domain